MLTVAIQAGGQSARMGEDKSLKSFLGKPLIQRVMERLSPIADELIVTTNCPADHAFLAEPQIGFQNLRIIADLEAGRGVLGGLYTAIVSASHPVVAAVACDMPFACADLIVAATHLLVKEEADVVIPKTKAGYEPFHAVYRRDTCLPAIASAMKANQWKVISWLPNVKVRTMGLDEIKSSDPSGRVFWNINTPEEFIQAEEAARRQ